jgi:hypothetical protein
MLVFQLVFAITLLSVIGEPLRILISNRTPLFRQLNLLQRYILDIYLGGFFLFFLASVPFGLLNEIVIWVFLSISVAFLIFYYKSYIRSFRLDKESWYNSLLTHKYEVAVCIVVLIMFLVFLWVQLQSIQDLVLGSIHDTSLHALLTTLVLENNQIPETHHPYVSGAVIYPMGSHTLFAFLSMIIKLEPSKVIFLATPFFNSLSVLGAYYFGKELKSHEVGLIFAFMLTFVSMWPLYTAWGANPFVVGLPLFFVCLTVIPQLFSIKSKGGIKEIIAAGLLVGYLGSLHLALAQIIIVTAVLWWLWSRWHSLFSKLKSLTRILLFDGVSLIPISIFIFRFLIYFSYPNRNLGIPNDLLSYGQSPLSPPSAPPLIYSLNHAGEMLLNNFNVNPYLNLRFLWLVLAVIGMVVPIYFGLRKKDVGKVERFSLSVFVSSWILVLMALVKPFTEIIDDSKIWFIMYMIICFFIGLFALRITQRVLRFFGEISIKKIMVTLMVFSILFSPFIYYRVVEDPKMLKGIYGLYSVTTEDDYELMVWMRDNLARDSVVLVNPYGGGNFIPSVSNIKIVYPFTAHVMSGSYLFLVDLIRLGAFNETTFNLMKEFNLTHLFVGSPVSTQIWWEKPLRWNSLVFINNLNFELVKNVGDSYLFHIVYRI